MGSSDQYLRKCTLIVSTGTKGLDLSDLRIVFRVDGADVQSPNTASIRIYNLSDTTAQQIQKEFTAVTLQAGYQTGNYGIIFAGTIKQVKRGKENATTTFVEILAADGDLAYNYSTISTSLAAGASYGDQVKAVAASMAANGVTQGDTSAMSATGGILPRGKVFFGMARDQMRNLAASTGTRWSIQNGKVIAIPLTGYLPGQAVVLNSKSGLIGVPEATEDGIRVKCLLNPMIKVGGRIQINNADINSTTVKEQGFPQYTSLNFFASVTNDGFYRVLVCSYEGDTRGQPWWADLTCLAVDSSAPVDDSVKAAG